MALGKINRYEGKVKKKTRQGCGIHSKGMKKPRGQGGQRKRCKLPKK